MHIVKTQKKISLLIFGALFILFLLHGTFSIVERFLFTNEIFAFAGLSIFILNATSIFKMMKQDAAKFFWVLHLIVASLLIGFLQILISFFFFNKAPNVYVFFRTCVIWYSVFSFFLGIIFFNYFGTKFLSSTNSIKASFYAIACSLSVDRYNLALMPLVLSKSKRIFFLVVLLIVVLLKKEDTPKLIFLFSLFFYGFNKRKAFSNNFFNYKIIVPLIIVFFAFFYYLYYNYSPFFELDVIFAYQYIGIEPSPGLANVIWRIMFWSYEFNTVTLANFKGLFFGFGFGVPVFNTQTAPPFLLIGSEKNFEEFYLGAHNSFLYLLFKQGIIVFSLFITMYFSFFSKIKKISKLYGKLPHKLYYYLFSFFLISISALFNVVLESSLFASIYWIITGMLYACLRQEIFKKTE